MASGYGGADKAERIAENNDMQITTGSEILALISPYLPKFIFVIGSVSGEKAAHSVPDFEQQSRFTRLANATHRQAKAWTTSPGQAPAPLRNLTQNQANDSSKLAAISFATGRPTNEKAH